MRKVKWTVVKSYFVKGKLVHQEIYGYSDKVKDCMKIIRGHKQIVLNGQEPFLYGAKHIRGIYNRSGLEVRAGNRLIEFRIYPVNIVMFD